MRPHLRSFFLALSLAIFFVPIHPAFADQIFTGLGDLPGGNARSFAYGVSADGSTVVGESASTAAYQEPISWTSAGGIVGLGGLAVGNLYSTAWSASDDGTVIVGNSDGASGNEAFRWTSGDGMVGLGALPGGSFFYSAAYGVSADGLTAVGESNSAAGFEAFAWTSGGGMTALGFLPGGSSWSLARATSDDGSVIVGESDDGSGGEAFRWTSGGGMVGLGHLPGGSFSGAHDVTGDGSVIVGESEPGSGKEAFFWTSGSGMTGLGHFPGGSYSSAKGVCADGSRVVGYSDDGANTEAFLWDPTNGMRKLSTVLTSLGLDLSGWTLYTAESISADCNTIVGTGLNPSGDAEGWIAVIEGPTDPDRFFIYLNAVATEHSESDATAQAYHAAIDPNNERLTLSAWRTLNGFDGGATAEATDINEADLGFGRNMFIKTHVDGRVSSYVRNHGDNTATGPGDDPVDGSAEEKINNAHNDLNLIATVAMEYGPPPGDPFGTFYTKFYAFDGNGDRIIKANLDSRGEKHLPGVCTVCHGGNPRPLLPDGSYPDDGNTQAGFLPWDLDTFSFSDTLFGGLPIYNRASQEAAFKSLNAAVLDTNPTPAAREVVEGWYGGPGLPNAVFDGSVVPAGWAGHEAAYREIYAPNCRACHVMRNPALAFQTYTDFVTLRSRANHLVFDRGIMPLARRTYNRFWDELSVSNAAMIDLFGSVSASRRPGSDLPLAFAGPDRSATVGVSQSLDATHSSYTTSFLWTAQSVPGGSSAAPGTPSAAVTSFVPDLLGTYVFQLTATNDQGSVVDTVTITATADGRDDGVDFATEILPIFTARCKSCHDGSSAPDYDGVGVSAFSPDYAEVVYQNFAARVSVLDSSESLLSQKSLGRVSHVGGVALSGHGELTLVASWINEGAVRVTTPSYQKRSGSFTQPIRTISGDIHLHRGADLRPSATLDGDDFESAYLVSADLNHASLISADFYNANLSYADLSGADLTNADLGLTDLTNATLDGAVGVTSAQIEGASSLYGVDLSNISPAGIDLSGRSLNSSKFSGTNLSGANLAGANLSQSDLAAADLSNAIGLASISGTPEYDANTNFTGTGFDPMAAGWSFVSPPTIPSLAPIGMVGLAAVLGFLGWRLQQPTSRPSAGKIR